MADFTPNQNRQTYERMPYCEDGQEVFEFKFKPAVDNICAPASLSTYQNEEKSE